MKRIPEGDWKKLKAMKDKMLQRILSVNDPDSEPDINFVNI
jgi:hypothetical protein